MNYSARVDGAVLSPNCKGPLGLLAAVWFGVRGAFWRAVDEDGGPARSDRVGDIQLVNAYAEEPRGDWAALGADLRVYA